MTAMLHAPTATREEWGNAQQCAAALTTRDRRITAAMIRKWAYNSRQPGHQLHGMIESKRGRGPRTGTTIYRFATVAVVAAATEPAMIG